MSEILKFDSYEMKLNHRKIRIEELLSHYDWKKVEGYCKNCRNYDKIWSCPPFHFDSYDYFKQYSSVIIYSGEISFNIESLEDEFERSKKVISIYDRGRKVFGEFLKNMESSYQVSEALIAGHCYLCDKCKRIEGQKCPFSDKIRYSLEGMGVLVSSLLTEVLNKELQWKSKKSNKLTVVGAILIK